MERSVTCVRHLGGSERLKRSSYANICYAQLAACQKQIEMRIECSGTMCNPYSGRCKNAKKSMANMYNLCRKDTFCRSENHERHRILSIRII